MNLGGLNILVTRPRERAAPLVQAIEGAGGSAVILPMLAIRELDPLADADLLSRNRNLLQSLDCYQRLIFISVNAVQYGLASLRTAREPLPPLPPVYAIGRATAEALAEAGVAVNAQAQSMDSESLLAQADLQQVAGERILIVRGVGGREHLADSLRRRGAEVDYLECYRREPPTLSREALQQALDGGKIDAITVNSGETLLHLSACLERLDVALRSIPVVVPSERVADLARERHFSRIIVADNAGVDATLKALSVLAA